MDTDVVAGQLSATLRDAYGIVVTDLAFVGGEVDRNYRVSTNTGRTFLAKLRPLAPHADGLEWQTEILIYAADQGIDVPIPAPVRATNGELETSVDAADQQWLLRVFDWVDGTEMINVACHSDALLADVGVTAAKVSKALDGFTSPTMPKTHHWDVTRAAEIIGACLAEDPTLGNNNPDVLAGLRMFEDIELLLKSLPRAVVHNDLNDNNILVGERDGRQAVTGVLDFNDALDTVRVAEPAIAGAYAMLRKDDPLTALGLVVAGFHSIAPLTEQEVATIYPLAVARLCVQVLTWTGRQRSSPSEYGAMRMRYTPPTLNKAVQVDPKVAAAHLRSVCEECR